MIMEEGRRNFIKKSGMATVSLVGLGMIPFACAPYRYGSFFIEEENIRILKSEFGKKQFLLIQPEGLSAPLLIQRKEDASYHALLMECTHKQCTISLAGEKLVCPCHGSEFSLEGKVIKSPAEADLKTFNVIEDESNIYIS